MLFSLKVRGGVFLGAFTKFRKATAICVTSVCPSVRVKNLVSHWMNFKYDTYVLHAGYLRLQTLYQNL